MIHGPLAVPILLAHITLASPQAVPVSLYAGVAHNANRNGPTAGLDIERRLNGPASIRLGVGYIPRALNDSGQTCGFAGCFTNGVNVRTDFMAFTALVVLAPDRPLLPYVAVGPYLATRLRCTDVTVGDCDRVDTSDGGLVLEAGAMLTATPPAVGVSIRYERALTATFQVPGGNNPDTDLHYQTLSVALRIRLATFGG